MYVCMSVYLGRKECSLPLPPCAPLGCIGINTKTQSIIKASFLILVISWCNSHPVTVTS